MLIARDANDGGVHAVAPPTRVIKIWSQILVDRGGPGSAAASWLLINLACPQSPGFLPALLPLSTLFLFLSFFLFFPSVYVMKELNLTVSRDPFVSRRVERRRSGWR